MRVRRRGGWRSLHGAAAASPGFLQPRWHGATCRETLSGPDGPTTLPEIIPDQISASEEARPRQRESPRAETSLCSLLDESLDDGARMSRAEEVWKSVRAEQKHVQQQLLIPLSNFYLAEDKYLSNQGRSENARERGREGRRESDTPSMITATLAAYGSVIHASASSRQEWKLTPRIGDERFDMRWKMSSG